MTRDRNSPNPFGPVGQWVMERLDKVKTGIDGTMQRLREGDAPFIRDCFSKIEQSSALDVIATESIGLLSIVTYRNNLIAMRVSTGPQKSDSRVEFSRLGDQRSPLLSIGRDPGLDNDQVPLAGFDFTYLLKLRAPEIHAEFAALQSDRKSTPAQILEVLAQLTSEYAQDLVDGQSEALGIFNSVRLKEIMRVGDITA